MVFDPGQGDDSPTMLLICGRWWPGELSEVGVV